MSRHAADDRSVEHEASGETTSNALTFTEWLRQVRVVYILLSAVLVVVLGILAPDRLIPEPLSPYRPLVSLIVVVGFVLTWALQHHLQRRLPWIASTVFLLLAGLVLMNVLFARQVQYKNPNEVVVVLIGPSIIDPDLKGMPDVEVIRMVGVGWGELEAAYGQGFVVVAVGYAFLYLLIATGITLGLGATQLSRPAWQNQRDGIA